MTAAAAKTISIPLTITVSEDTLENAITAGMIRGVHGYAYWCQEVQFGRAAPCHEIPSEPDDEQIARNVIAGGTATFIEVDEDSGKRHRLTLSRDKLLAGFARWVLEGGARHAYDAATGSIEFDIDAPQSDVIMQFALFGEQRYG